MTITIIGTGFVGVVSAAVYASFGHTVIGLDVDEKKIQTLRSSEVPFFEPNLESLLKEQQARGNLTFTTNYAEAIPQSEIILIAVGTPSAPDGQADLKYVFASIESLAPHLSPDTIVAIKSTVPPGTLEIMTDKITALTDVPFYAASLPEFLREGSAVEDTLNPDRVVIGATADAVFEKLEALHRPFNAPIVRTSPRSAQMAKYAANAYLATRITFINQIADLCDKNGADVQEVAQAIGYDNRIGTHYWYPGFGYGGSCFPKDVSELAAYSRAIGEENNLFNKVHSLNQGRIVELMNAFAKEVGGWQDKQVAVLGLSFKPNTDDMREAPALKIVPYLLEAGATVAGFDPKAVWTSPVNGFSQVATIEAAVAEADVIISVIEWPEIVSFDFAKTKVDKPQWFIDGRNQFPPQVIAQAGYTYIGIGRPTTK